MTDCRTCKSNSGEERVSPGPVIYESEYWLVDHMYPVKLPGWLVIVSKRHIDYVHSLSTGEWTDFGHVAQYVGNRLRILTRCERLYVAFFAETAGFHLHAHLIPKPPNLPKEFKGPNIFRRFTTADEAESISKEETIEMSIQLRKLMLSE